MKKDKKMSLHEHLQTADNMAIVVHHMNLIFGIVQKHYPMNHKLYIEIQRVRGRLSELKSILDAEYHGIIDNETWEIYRNIYYNLVGRYYDLEQAEKEKKESEKK